jgi:hypothetical protein
MMGQKLNLHIQLLILLFKNVLTSRYNALESSFSGHILVGVELKTRHLLSARVYYVPVSYIKGQSTITTVLKQSKIDTTVSTFVFISSWWLSYMFRPFSWIILICELHLNQKVHL